MNIRNKLRSFDYLLALAVIALSVYSLLLINSVAALQTRYSSLPGNQRLYVISGIVLMLVFALVDYHFIARFFIAIYALCIALLGIVLFIGADDITGTARWILIPVGPFDMSLQPSEFAKIFLIIFFAGFIYKLDKRFNHPLWLGVYIILTAVPVAFIMSQPSLSASMVSAVIALTILFAGGLYYRTIFTFLFLLTPAAVVLYFDMRRNTPIFITKLLNERQWERVETFLNPVPGTDEFLQVYRSLQAIGKGGLFGKGYMKNTEFIIHGHNDFIFAVSAEQFGFLGSVLLLGVIGFVIVKCMITAYRAADILGRLIAAGVAGMLLFETFVNVGVATSLLPNTGMPFPFLSYGGTAMWVHMAAVGMVLNISLFRAENPFPKA